MRTIYIIALVAWIFTIDVTAGLIAAASHVWVYYRR